MSDAHCRYCEQTHDDRWVCDQIKRILDALYARGAELTMPDVTFPAPIPGHELGMGLDPAAGDRVVAQVVVNAAVVDLGDVAKPVLIFTGLDSYNQPLPRWAFPGDPVDLDNLIGLMRRMAALAIRTARQQNRRPA